MASLGSTTIDADIDADTDRSRYRSIAQLRTVPTIPRIILGCC